MNRRSSALRTKPFPTPVTEAGTSACACRGACGAKNGTPVGENIMASTVATAQDLDRARRIRKGFDEVICFSSFAASGESTQVSARVYPPALVIALLLNVLLSRNRLAG